MLRSIRKENLADVCKVAASARKTIKTWAQKTRFQFSTNLRARGVVRGLKQEVSPSDLWAAASESAIMRQGHK